MTVLAARLLLLVAVRGVASQQSVDVWITHGLDNVFRDAMPPEGAPSVIGLTTARGETGAAQATLLAVLPCSPATRAIRASCWPHASERCARLRRPGDDHRSRP